jgi:hypothetical protein
MKKIMNIPAVVAAVLTMAAVGVSSARAGGVVVMGAPPTYYVYPHQVYVAPVCAPTPVILAPAPVCYAPRRVIYPYYYPSVRVFAARPHYFWRR